MTTASQGEAVERLGVRQWRARRQADPACAAAGIARAVPRLSLASARGVWHCTSVRCARRFTGVLELLYRLHQTDAQRAPSPWPITSRSTKRSRAGDVAAAEAVAHVENERAEMLRVQDAMNLAATGASTKVSQEAKSSGVTKAQRPQKKSRLRVRRAANREPVDPPLGGLHTYICIHKCAQRLAAGARGVLVPGLSCSECSCADTSAMRPCTIHCSSAMSGNGICRCRWAAMLRRDGSDSSDGGDIRRAQAPPPTRASRPSSEQACRSVHPGTRVSWWMLRGVGACDDASSRRR